MPSLLPRLFRSGSAQVDIHHRPPVPKTHDGDVLVADALPGLSGDVGRVEGGRRTEAGHAGVGSALAGVLWPAGGVHRRRRPQHRQQSQPCRPGCLITGYILIA